MRKKRRKLERKWQKSKSNSDWNDYKNFCVTYSNTLTAKKEEYFKLQLSNADSKKLHNTCRTLLNRSMLSPLPISASNDPKAVANNFNTFFIQKIEKIRNTIPILALHHNMTR